MLREPVALFVWSANENKLGFQFFGSVTTPYSDTAMLVVTNEYPEENPVLPAVKSPLVIKFCACATEEAQADI